MVDQYVALVVSGVILLFAGMVKGSIGFGLPLVAVPFLTTVNSVETALATMTVPVMVSSVQMAFSGGRFPELSRRYWTMLAGLFVGVMVGVSFVVSADGKLVSAVLGGVIILFTLFGLLSKRLSLSLPRNPVLEAGVGGLAGLLGGVSTAYGPFIATYFTVRKLDKNEFVTALNIMLMCGAGFMVAFFGAYDVYTRDTAVLSVLACVPTLAGVKLGERLRQRIRNDLFHRIVQVVLLFMGLNLVRQALF